MLRFRWPLVLAMCMAPFSTVTGQASPDGGVGSAMAGVAPWRPRVADTRSLAIDMTRPAFGSAATSARLRVDSSDVPVRAETKGAEVTVVRVPIPAAIRLDAAITLRPITYRLVLGRHAQVLGALSGRLPATKDSALVVAFRVSRRAPAGRSLAATAEFSVGTIAVSVPIELDVPPRRQLALAMDSRALLATRGRWTTMPLRVINAGNVEELAAVGVAVPQGWRADVKAASRVRRVAAGQTLPLSLRLWIPEHANSGMVMLPVRLVRPGERDTTEQLQVDVIGDLAREQTGTRLITSMISGRTSDNLSATAYAVGLAGNLSDSTTINGRVSYAGSVDGTGTRGMMLARSGMLTGPPVLEVRHPRMHLQAGAALVSQAELGGHHLAGIGGAVSLERANLVFRGFDLRPFGTAFTASMLPIGDGRLQGAELGFTGRRVRATAFGSRLNDAFTRRTLNAYGVRTGLGEAGRLQFVSEVAYRETGHQRGVGIMSMLQHAGARSYFEARALHAPGGSAAFARAAEDFSLSASRSIGQRGFVAVTGWRQRDENPMLGALRNSGWSIAPAFDLPLIGTVGVDARGSTFHSAIEGTRLGSDELSGGAMWTKTVLGASLITRSTLARIDRHIADSVWASRSQQWRVDHSVSVLRAAAHGTLQANWTYQQFSAAGGNLPAQQSIHLRAERLRPRLSSPLSFEGEVQRMQVGSVGAGFWSARAAVTLDLRFGMSVTFAAERNPFLTMMAGARRAPLAYTLRVDRTTVVPRLLSGARNVVFRDENGNGKRDRSERGVAGVVIKCGARLVQTDNDGRFACAEREQQLDARTVPVGLLAARVAVNAGTPVALRVVQPLRVSLRLTGADSLRLRVAMLSEAVVFARDTTGVTWYARKDTTDAFVLEALPAGRYRVGVDASALEEPLSMVNGEPVIEIGSRDQATAVTIDLRARPIRVKTFDATTPVSPIKAGTTAPQRAKRGARATTVRSVKGPRPKAS